MKKKVLIILSVIVGAWLLLAIVVNVTLKIQINNAMKWKRDDDITSEDRTRYGQYVMIPEIADYIESVAYRGVRDPTYRIESKPYSSIEKLYAILPFSTDDERKKAIDSAKNAETTYEDLIDGGQALHYIIDDLPVNTKDEDGNNSIYSSWSHRNYLLESQDGYRLILVAYSN